MEGTLKDSRQILMLAFRSIVESARKVASKFHALIYNLPIVNTISPDYNTNEDVYERILLNEAEGLYDKMIANHMNDVVSNIMSKSNLPFEPRAELCPEDNRVTK
jgi:hypothetical protein